MTQSLRGRLLVGVISLLVIGLVISDVATVLTLVSGGIALKLTLSKSKTHEVNVSLMPNGIQVAGSFR